jgi:hypothetical protein
MSVVWPPRTKGRVHGLWGALAAVGLCSACQMWTGYAPAPGSSALQTSYLEPPPPQETWTPLPRPGYSWQPGYWVREANTRWRWIQGQWFANYPGLTLAPIHWERSATFVWRLMPGAWVTDWASRDQIGER